eukprot:scaffold12274_cov21-Tisochrysis_lutea.AAC.1
MERTRLKVLPQCWGHMVGLARLNVLGQSSMIGAGFPRGVLQTCKAPHRVASACCARSAPQRVRSGNALVLSILCAGTGPHLARG